MKKILRKFAVSLSLACLALLPVVLSGCTSYRLGSTLPPDLKSIFVPVFVNEAGYPQLEVTMTSATIENFQRDGMLKIEPRDNADLILEVKLQQYRLVPLRYQKDSAVSATEYRVHVVAQMTLRKKNGKVLIDKRRVRGESTFEFSGDIATAQQKALPSAAKDMAHRIVEEVVEYW